MEELNFVTGANGHLGNTLVRSLLAQGKNVRAGVRNPDDRSPFTGLDCPVVATDLLDGKSLAKALEGVDTLYQVAAVFRHWAKDPQTEIIDANLQMTENILKAAEEQGVRKIVYVSSIAALDRKIVPLHEGTWNQEFKNPYFQAKTVAEQLAWKLAEKLNLQMVAVLPSAIIGPHVYREPTPTMSLFVSIINNQLPFDPDFNFNFVHVADVATGMIAAAEKGRSGERYILATEPAISVKEVIETAQALFPEIKAPAKLDYNTLIKIAASLEAESEKTGIPPALLLSNIELSYQADIRIDISKARKELGYHPMAPQEAIRETLIYLHNRRGGIQQ